MATERPLRLAIIGAGSRGLTYGRESVRTGTAVVAAVAEPRPDRRSAAAAEFGVAATWSVADWSELA
ncbi:MAG TPA: gfo/Idh/MocA family oxidoreductase, partial [Propionibacteriaceae bacterium]|nr:gfo/Idh/MocA family oxidoreductase [Propionibacteriaceae bacterium]